MLLDICQFDELVNDALPVAKKFALEQDMEMVGYEVRKALYDLERLLNKIEQCEKIAAEQTNKAA
jgi:hypothetical protein